MQINFGGKSVELISVGTAVVGSGAAGFCAANSLLRKGVTDVVLLTENINGGTSRNTGSDKQTYYKLTLSGDVNDSVEEMAKTFFSGGSMDGDIALVEAALSVRGFMHLVEIGVPFPSSRYGEYIGYKTDHDPKTRATSAGPLTSKMMTECLQKEANTLKLKILNNHQIIRILSRDNMLGLLCLNGNDYRLYNCHNIVLATGGPAKIYHNTVYPSAQNGASGMAFEAGIKGKNLTEWQYGLASIKPRWNVSGSFMQVLPRFVSTNVDGSDEQEFLQDYLKDEGDLLTRIFLKGYQWPFDVRKCTNGSSLIDILVYEETVIKGRRVFLDFLHNPYKKEEVEFSEMSKEAQEYLKASGVMFGTPLQRLQHMNMPAYEFYLNRGVDLGKEMLEIALCAQHNNGGMGTNCWWETNIEGCFSIGEVCGSHGVYRPGGSALNSGQVGALRVADYISQKRNKCSENEERFIELFGDDVSERIQMGQSLIKEDSNLEKLIFETQKAMDGAGASIRSERKINQVLSKIEKIYLNFQQEVTIKYEEQLKQAYRFYDTLIAQITYLSAMRNYIQFGGTSRGSSLYFSEEGELPHPNLSEEFRYSLKGKDLSDKIQEVKFKKGKCSFFWRDVRDIPKSEDFFENVWRMYRENKNVY